MQHEHKEMHEFFVHIFTFTSSNEVAENRFYTCKQWTVPHFKIRNENINILLLVTCINFKESTSDYICMHNIL